MPWKLNIFYLMLMTAITSLVWTVSAGVFMGMAGYLEPVDVSAMGNDPTAALNAVLSMLPLTLVCFVMALIAIWFVNRSAVRGLKLGLLVFGLVFGIMFFMTQIETIYFISAVKMPWQVLVATLSSGILVSIALALLAMRLGYKRGEPALAEGIDRQNLFLKFSLISLIYIVIYFLAGYYIAWQVPELRQYYAGSTELMPFLTHMSGVFKADYWLILFQAFRGFLWAAIAYYILQGLIRIYFWERILILATAFGVLPVIALIISNPFMPEVIRWAHFYEVLISNFIFGALIAAIFSGAKSDSTK